MGFLARHTNDPANHAPHPVHSEFIVEVHGATVAYRSYKERPTGIKESIIKAFKNRRLKHYSTFNALNNVDVTIRRGKVFGLVGSNGSGKSTLLKVIAGVLKPTAGSVEVRGSVASLIELGAGFDHELNAIENIYLHGSLHGRTRKEIKQRVEHIIDFAELNEFATTPIKYYSSGMFARLGFSVAVDTDPDILLVDEILAVGDERFQEKCLNVFKKFRESGKTIILVTHDMDLVMKETDESAVLQRGEVIFQGYSDRAVSIYRDISYQTALS